MTKQTCEISAASWFYYKENWCWEQLFFLPEH